MASLKGLTEPLVSMNLMRIGEDIEQLGSLAEKCSYEYNFYHLHHALEYKAPCQYASRYSKYLNPCKEE